MKKSPTVTLAALWFAACLTFAALAAPPPASQGALEEWRALRARMEASEAGSSQAPDAQADVLGLPEWMRAAWRTTLSPGQSARDREAGQRTYYPHLLAELARWVDADRAGRDGDDSGGTMGTNDDDADEASPPIDARLTNDAATEGAEAETAIAVDPANPRRVVAGAIRFGIGRFSVPIYSSKDAGRTWTESALPRVEQDVHQADPKFAWSADGSVWAAILSYPDRFDAPGGFYFKIRVYRSTDGGLTWRFEGTPSRAETVTDRPAIAVDNSPQSRFRGSVYVIWQDRTGGLFSSRRRAATTAWPAAKRITGAETKNNAFGADLRTDAQGAVYAAWPDLGLDDFPDEPGSQNIYWAQSRDGGVSFSKPRRLASVVAGAFGLRIPAASVRSIPVYVSLAASRLGTQGVLHAAWADWTRVGDCVKAHKCRSRIWYARSLDGAKSWQTPRPLETGPPFGDQFHPALAVDPKTQRIGIAYYDTREDASRETVQVAFKYSTDQGATWSQSRVVSSAPSSGFPASGFGLGDYSDLAAGANIFLPGWTDQRAGTPPSEMWFAPLRKLSTAGAEPEGDPN